MLEDYLEALPYEIQGWEVGDDDFVLNVRVNGCWFKIPVSPDCFVNSPNALQVFHDIFAKVVAGEDDCFEVWDYSEDIAVLFIPEFQKLAPATVHTGKLTIADLASHGSFECGYRVIDEKPIAAAATPCLPEAPPEEWNLRTLQPPFPIFNVGEVEVPYSDGASIYDIIPQQVSVNGGYFFYKSCEWPHDALAELGKHAKIQASGLPLQELRVSRLVGIVASHQGFVNGFLYEWIDTRDDTGRLASIITSETPAALREKWILQIRSTVTRLHQLDIVWGDAKADNVIIDRNDDIVIIGLEGGSTEGWVDCSVAETVEGDLQGMDRLTDFIANDESPLRLSQHLNEDFEDDFDEEMTDD